MTAWNVLVDGKEYEISVEPGTSDKFFVRVNGRLAAAAIAPPDHERRINVAGVTYAILRTDGGFDLIRLEAETNPAGKPPTSRFAPMLLWAAAAIAAFPVLFWLRGMFYESRAEDRVKALLAEMHDGGTETARSLGLWAGQLTLNPRDQWQISDSFVRWENRKQLYKRAFSVYRVTGSRLLWRTSPPTVVVSFSLDGADYRVRVPHGAPLEWDDPPPLQARPMRRLADERPPMLEGGPMVIIEGPKQEAPHPPDPPEKAKGDHSSLITIRPNDDPISKDRLLQFGYPNQQLEITAVDDRLSDASEDRITRLYLTTWIVVTGSQTIDVRIEGRGVPIQPGHYTTHDRPAQSGMFFDLHVYPNGGCENTGTLDITSLEFIPGKTIETSGGRSLYVTKLDATFTIRCAGSAYPTVGEIHFIAPPP